MSNSSHKWEKKRTYDLPGPRLNPEVTVSECVLCGMIKEKSRWHDPSPQYFENDTRDAKRVTNSYVLSECVEGKCPADCPCCGDGGFVTSRTNGMGEAECLTQNCRVTIFEVDSDD